jgi:acetate kinase
MKVLVFNAGSSSLKFQHFDVAANKLISKGMVDGIGLPTCKVVFDGKEEVKPVKDHNEAVKIVFQKINPKEVDAIGHRVVHGGDIYSNSVKIDDKVISDIKNLESLAPLHNPINLVCIVACKLQMPKIPQVAVFDTAFHQTISETAYLYAIPFEYYKKYQIRKYGFHGTSHKYLTLEAQKILKKKKVNIITCHLGNGSSIDLIKESKSIDTSMGFTPLQGLIMGTRSGDIDPEIVGFLEEKEKKAAKEIITMLNKKSGLLGISGHSDVRALRENSLKGDKMSILALDMFAYRVTQYVSAYLGLMGEKTDAIVFSAGVGCGAYYLREKICNNLKHLGVVIDEKKNNANNKIDVSSKKSKIKILVIPTNEELMIAKETKDVLSK